MAFAVYLAVLLVAGASVLFGLDLMTAPLPDKAPQVEASAPNKLERRQADRAEASKQARAADDRALSPVFPTAPENKEVRMVYPPLNETQGQPPAQTRAAETTGSANAGSSSPAAEISTAKQSTASTSSTASAPPREPSTAGSASPDIKPAPQEQPATKSASESNDAHVTPATAKAEVPKTSEKVEATTASAGGSCNVSACAAAYRSFRSSDCTYQPYQGPRRVCTSPSSPQSSTASLDSDSERRRADRTDELRAVERRVRELTSGDDAADDYIDGARGRRVIVIERGYFDRIDGSNFR